MLEINQFWSAVDKSTPIKVAVFCKTFPATDSDVTSVHCLNLLGDVRTAGQLKYTNCLSVFFSAPSGSDLASGNYSYMMYFYTAACRFWNESTDEWDTSGCSVSNLHLKLASYAG